MENKITQLRQPDEHEMKEMLALFTDGYAPNGIINDLEEMFALALDGARRSEEIVSLDIINAYWGLRQVAKVLRYFDPYNLGVNP